MTDIHKSIDIACMLSNGAHTDFEVSLYDVPITCDCEDYAFIRVARYIKHSPFLGSAYCAEPNNLYGRNLGSVPADQLVCDIFDQCPTGCKCTEQPATLTIHVNCTNANLTEMPLQLPLIKKQSSYKYNLILPGNKIDKVSNIATTFERQRFLMSATLA